MELNKRNDKHWLEFHVVCGDCGRRIKDKIDLETHSLKKIIAIVKLYYPKNNMSCNRCSNKEQKKIITKIKHKKAKCVICGKPFPDDNYQKCCHKCVEP
jgi:hypothetical protein